MTSLRKGDDDLHHEDGTHRTTPPTTRGRALANHERRLRRHLEEHATMIQVTHLFCPESGGQPGEDNTTHHLVPRSAGGKGMQQHVCSYCGKTEKQLREAAAAKKDLDLPDGYRWATAEESELYLAGKIRGLVVISRTADSTGRPYTQGEADLAIKL